MTRRDLATTADGSGRLDLIGNTRSMRAAPRARASTRAGLGGATARVIGRRSAMMNPLAHGLRFAGLHACHRDARHLRTVQKVADAVRAAAARVDIAKGALAGAALACPRVTGGGTGAFALDTAHLVRDEPHCGSHLFMDRDCPDNEPAPLPGSNRRWGSRRLEAASSR